VHRKVPAWFGPGAVGEGTATSGNLANGLPVLLARVRGLNRLELAGETVRAGLEALAAAAPDWLAGVIDASWQQVYGTRVDQIRLPASDAARQKLAVQYGKDGYHLLEAVQAPGAPGWLRELPAVQALRAVCALCRYRHKAHGLRDLRAVYELDPDGQVWARSMADLLVWANTQATAARAAGQARLSDTQLAAPRCTVPELHTGPVTWEFAGRAGTA